MTLNPLTIGERTEAIRAALRCDEPGCECQRSSGNVHCPVPGHGKGQRDRRPSLSVNEGSDRVLVYCHARCPQPAVIEALGLRGLWWKDEDGSRPRSGRITRYELRDPDGNAVAVHIRRELSGGRKSFAWERHDGTLGLGGRLVTSLPLYGVHLLRDRPGEPVILVEGEKAAKALLDAGRLALGTVTGAGGTPSVEVLRLLVGREVLLWPDADEPGRQHMEHVGVRLQKLGVSPRLVEWQDAPPGGDAADFIDRRGEGMVLEELLGTAHPIAAPAEVDTAALLTDVAAFVQRYVVMTVPQLVAVALWALHCWAIEAAEITPYLAISSPTRRAGKTKLLEVLELLVDALRAANISVAALFRSLAHATALLLDEVDATFAGKGDHEDLRGLLNAGYKRGATVLRCEVRGAAIGVVRYDAFGPKALAFIDHGAVPDTIIDRSISIRMERRARSEPIARFRLREAQAIAAELRTKLMAWVTPAVIEALRDARPDLPEVLDDRAADGWEPLIAIADLAGGAWPRRAREAAVALSTGEFREDDSLSIRLLGDIRHVFSERGTDRIFTSDLLEALRAEEEAPWRTWGKEGKGLTAHGLARLLRPFGIRSSGTLRSGPTTAKGYERVAFEGAFSRYLPPGEAFEPSQSSQPAFISGFGGPFEPSHRRSVTVTNSDESPRLSKGVTDVTVHPPAEGVAESERITLADVESVLGPVEELYSGLVGEFSRSHTAGEPGLPALPRKLSLRRIGSLRVASPPERVCQVIRTALERGPERGSRPTGREVPHD